MNRDAFLGARLLLAFLGGSLALSFALVLVGAPDHATFGPMVRAAVLSVGSAYGANGSMSIGNAVLSATAHPLLVSLLPVAGSWWLLRRAPVRPEWVGAAAGTAGLMLLGMVEWANGVHGVSVDAGLAGLGLALAVGLTGGLAWAVRRPAPVGRALDLVMVAALGVVLLGLAAEVVAWVSESGGGTGHVPMQTEIALAVAYAPNAGVGALALGLGGGLAVTGISSEYSTFVARFAGDGPTANFGAPHGEGAWAHALHLPGLVSVFVLAPVLVLATAWSARRLRDRAELMIWSAGLVVLYLGLSVLASVRLGVGYDGFELVGSLAPTVWGRVAGLLAVPAGFAVFLMTRSASEPGLDVGDRTRELSREVP